ncbi:MAG: RNA polymerase sigma factor [Syntrophotaleaceae bacterium]
MEAFLTSIERRAYRMALIASSNREDALDLVQEAMCRFVAKYADKPRSEWKPLFYRILHNQIRDFYRRQSIRSRWRIWFKGPDEEESGDCDNPLEAGSDPKAVTPEGQISLDQAAEALQKVLRTLPLRQQQAFLLRCWEELSVAETARVMGCSEGSVKTHLSRAVKTLRDNLGDYWP